MGNKLKLRRRRQPFIYYGPILVLGSLNTVLGKLGYKRMHLFLLKYIILTPEQPGFKCDKSANTAVFSLVQFVNELPNEYNFFVEIF